MRIFDKIAIVLCILSVVGVVLWSSVVCWAGWNGAAYKTPDQPPAGFWVFGSDWARFLNHWFGKNGLVFRWMVLGMPGVFIFGLYFCISKRAPLRRAMMLLCFLATWVIILMSAQFVLKGLDLWIID